MLSFFLTREYSEGNNDMLRTKRNELSLIWLKQGQALELRNFSYINLPTMAIKICFSNVLFRECEIHLTCAVQGKYWITSQVTSWITIGLNVSFKTANLHLCGLMCFLCCWDHSIAVHTVCHSLPYSHSHSPPVRATYGSICIYIKSSYYYY